MKGQPIGNEHTIRRIVAAKFRWFRQEPLALDAWARGWLAGITIMCSAETWRQSQRLVALLMERQMRIPCSFHRDDLYNTFGCPPTAGRTYDNEM